MSTSLVPYIAHYFDGGKHWRIWCLTSDLSIFLFHISSSMANGGAACQYFPVKFHNSVNLSKFSPVKKLHYIDTIQMHLTMFGHSTRQIKKVTKWQAYHVCDNCKLFHIKFNLLIFWFLANCCGLIVHNMCMHGCCLHDCE